jgi:DNA-binding transcriptional MocR family regulator
MDIVLDSNEQTPAIEQVVRSIRGAIQRSELKPGQRLPSIRQMCARNGLSFYTVVGAYERLQSNGLISAQAGRGYYVRATPSLRSTILPSDARLTDSGKMAAFWHMFHGDDRYMKLGCGWLPPAWHDTKELARLIRRTANFAHSSLVEYGDPSGYLPLRQNLALHLSAKLQVSLDASHLLTTLGATQALDLVIRHLIEPGDEVLVDDPCNSTLVQLLNLRGARVIGVARLPDGPDMETFERAVTMRKVKAFFINSQLHNPTGTSLSPRSAFLLLQMAYAHDVILVEDDVYGDFCSNQNSLVTLDGLRKVIYIGSFSKTLSANLRVGYVVAPAVLLAELADLKLFTSVAVPSFFERFVCALLVDGTYMRHLEEVRRRLQTAQAVAQENFRAWGWEIFYPATEGMFIWVRHPAIETQDAFLEQAFRSDILLAPGSLFSATGEPNPWFRINVAHLDMTKAEPLFGGLSKAG